MPRVREPRLRAPYGEAWRMRRAPSAPGRSPETIPRGLASTRGIPAREEEPRSRTPLRRASPVPTSPRPRSVQQIPGDAELERSSGRRGSRGEGGIPDRAARSSVEDVAHAQEHARGSEVGGDRAVPGHLTRLANQPEAGPSRVGSARETQRKVSLEENEAPCHGRFDRAPGRRASLRRERIGTAPDPAHAAKAEGAPAKLPGQGGVRYPARAARARDRGYVVEASGGVRAHVPAEVVGDAPIRSGELEIEPLEWSEDGRSQRARQAAWLQGGIPRSDEAAVVSRGAEEVVLARGRQKIHPGRPLVRQFQIQAAAEALGAGPERPPRVPEGGLLLAHVVRGVESRSGLRPQPQTHAGVDASIPAPRFE